MAKTRLSATADTDEPVAELQLDDARIGSWKTAEEFLLTVTGCGFGKRTSAYEYRVTGRGGQGIANITLAPRNGTAVVATLPVEDGGRRDAGDGCGTVDPRAGESGAPSPDGRRWA